MANMKADLKKSAKTVTRISNKMQNTSIDLIECKKPGEVDYQVEVIEGYIAELEKVVEQTQIHGSGTGSD